MSTPVAVATKPEHVLSAPEFGTPIIWGKRGSGKTLFGLNSPYQPVHIIDVENSSADYELHMDRLIERGFFPQKFTRKFTPQSRDFMIEIDRISKLPKGTFGTIVIDTIGQVTEWVKTDEFNKKTPDIQQKMSQVIWGLVRDRLRNMLLLLNSLSPMIILLAHEREYPIGKFSPRCNPGILELTSVSVRLVRDPNIQLPDGLVTYARLPFFPPRINQITLTKMLEFIERPADWDKLSEEEKQPLEPVYVPPVGVPPESEDDA